jgi:hypothetical protein
MNRRVRERIGHAGDLLALMLIAIFAAACGVAESYRIALDAPPGSGVACRSTLGSYALPKAHLQVLIQQPPAGRPEIAMQGPEGAATDPVAVVRHPDPSLIFCLDHLASAFAADNITVKKWRSDSAEESKSPFLGAVTFNATDETAYIINALLRSLFILGTGDPDFAPRTTVQPAEQLADLVYDPFDPIDSAGVNARLTKLGFCFVLEDYTFDTSRVGIQAYCDAPELHGAQPSRVAAAYLSAASTPANPHQPGLFYRPRHPYRLSIYSKADPGRRAPWRLSRTFTVELENMSPVLSLGISRAIFAGRNASFVFDQGTLLNACVAKSSELEGFVEIPLEIAKSIVEVPASIVKVRIGQAENEKLLLQTESLLYAAQKAQLEAITKGTYGSPVQRPDSPRQRTKVDLRAPPTGLKTRAHAFKERTEKFGALCEVEG